MEHSYYLIAMILCTLYIVWNHSCVHWIDHTDEWFYYLILSLQYILLGSITFVNWLNILTHQFAWGKPKFASMCELNLLNFKILTTFYRLKLETSENHLSHTVWLDKIHPWIYHTLLTLWKFNRWIGSKYTYAFCLNHSTRSVFN